MRIKATSIAAGAAALALLGGAAEQAAARPAPTTWVKQAAARGDDVARGSMRLRLAALGRSGRAAVLVDRNRDGRFEGGLFDSSGDGRFDLRWVDRDRDGRADRGEVVALSRKAAKATWCMAAIPCNANAVRPALKPLKELGDVGEFDLDGDFAPDTVTFDPNRGPSGSRAVDADRDGNPDGIVVGTAGGVTPVGTATLGLDTEPLQLVVEDPTLEPAASRGYDLDGDGQDDLWVVGTKGGGSVAGTADADDQTVEREIVVCDPTREPGASLAIRDEDGNVTIILVGTKGGAEITGIADDDGDGDDEIHVSDPQAQPGPDRKVEIPGQDGPVVVVTGTGGTQ